jgi:acetate kinase
LQAAQGWFQMYILVFNAGSSSVKFTCFGSGPDQILAEGMVERIGLQGTMLHYQASGGKSIKREVDLSTTGEAANALGQCLVDADSGCLESYEQIQAVGHRVVHGGEKINQPVVINKWVKEVIQEYFELAPLHNPPNLEAIEAAEAMFPQAVQVGVFDTAFHTTVPRAAYLYALPLELYENAKIRRYGFHGISHQYVSRTAAQHLQIKPSEFNGIICHLGNGCSVTAVKGGQSVDTSMGLTPLEGLVMGTRCGDLDPAIVLHLMEHRGLSLAETNALLNKQSGLLGLTGGKASDLRDIIQAGDSGDANARTALKAFCYRLRKYIGAYSAALGRLDAVMFTAGIGENSPLVRRLVLEDLDILGIKMDESRNDAAASKGIKEIQASESAVKLLVVPTQEEKEILGQVLSVLDTHRNGS